jgi:hypothetical protein|tara:strand:+ start:310 stop:750 length:441 start_codon:yes stop_codon:yes gene_type:complete
MKQNLKITILITTLIISSCSLTGRNIPNPVEITTAPIEIEIYHPPLPQAIRLERPDWYVVSENNIDEFIAKLAKVQSIEGTPTFFAMSPQGYEKMSGNLQEMRRYILEQKEIIVYYKDVTTPDRPQEESSNSNRPTVGIKSPFEKE